MVIVKIFGGLGNQMFQYAFAKYIATKHGSILLLDTSYYKNQGDDTKRIFRLNIFNIPEINFSRDEDISQIIKIKKNKALRAIQKKLKLQTKYLLEEKSFNFDKNLKKWDKRSALMVGYFQSEKYFQEIRHLIKEEFKLKPGLISKDIKKIKNKISTEESVSIHVRRGDYVSNNKVNKYHGVLPLEYYKDATDIMKKKVSNPVFYIFSDDIEWCKNNFKVLANNLEFIEGLKDYEDLELMRSCKHNIIANSSFSWWGGWLNNNKNKVIIAPINWFNYSQNNTDDLIPNSWIKI